MNTGPGIMVKAARLAPAVALILGVAACGDDRPFTADRRPTVEGARLTVPTRLTPPVRVEGIDGAPEDWSLNSRVAEALRQRDIPAGTGGAGRVTYVLRGHIRQGRGGGDSTQLMIEWVLSDPDGEIVGTVSQMAALPGAGTALSDDLVDAVADAAAESVSPLVPSANIARVEMAGTGERPANTRRQVENENPVTAIGRMGDSGSPLSRRLLSEARENGDETGNPSAAAENAGADPEMEPVTAVARMSSSGTLSRNLMEGTAADDARAGTARTRPGSSFASGTSSNAPGDDRQYADAGDQADPPAGSMEELFRQDGGAPEEDRARGPDDAGNGEHGTTSARTSRRETSSSETGDENGAASGAQRDDAGAAQARPGRRTTQRAERTRASGTVWWVQIGSYRSRDEANENWAAMKTRAQGLLGEANHRIYRISLEGRGVYHRLQVGPLGGQDAARSLCDSLKANGLDCFLLRERGEPPAARRGAAREDRSGADREDAGPAARPAEPGAADEEKPEQRPAAQARTTEQEPVEARETPARADDSAPPGSTGGPGGQATDGAPITTSPGIPGILD